MASIADAITDTAAYQSNIQKANQNARPANNGCSGNHSDPADLIDRRQPSRRRTDTQGF
jgi:hypothetical protein